MERSGREAVGWQGNELFDARGEKIGTIGGLAFRRPRFGTFWLLVNATDKVVLVPTEQIRHQGDRLVLPYSRTYVGDAPSLNQGGRLSRQEARKLVLHYGLDSQLAEGGCPQRCGLCESGRRRPKER